MEKIYRFMQLVMISLLVSCTSVPNTAEITRLGVLSITSDRALVGVRSGERYIKGYPVDIGTWKINDVLTAEVVDRVSKIEWVDLREELGHKIDVPKDRYVRAANYREEIEQIQKKYALDGILVLSNRVTSRDELAQYREYGYMPDKEVFKCAPHTFATVSIQYWHLGEEGLDDFRRTTLHKTCVEEEIQTKPSYTDRDLLPVRQRIEQDGVLALREALDHFFPGQLVKSTMHSMK